MEENIVHRSANEAAVCSELIRLSALLTLPKEHYADLYELPEETACDVMKVAKKMAVKMKDRLGCEGLNLVQNNGDLAGQTVFHFHMHMIPRYAADGQKIGWKPGEPEEEELEEIRKALAD